MGRVRGVPGVYVEEDNSLSFAVTSGETAVPVFSAIASDIDALGLRPAGENAVHVALFSWLDVANCIKKKEIAESDCVKLRLYLALYAYFANGGGRLYVCETGNFGTVVPGLPDVTLLVEAGVGRNKFKADLDALPDNKLFGLLDAHQAWDKSVLPDPHASAYTASYFPWLSLPAVEGRSPSYEVPPSAVAAGVYCRVDRERGVWKAPANEPVRGGLLLEHRLTDGRQAVLTERNDPINVIRQFGDGPPVIWGARTGTVKNDLRWRYVPVRRLFNAVEKDIAHALNGVLFEPNTSVTWVKVSAAIDHYLHQLWRDGGLMGDKPSEAYSIQIGLGSTMTQQDLAAGVMKATIGIAAARPAEFIYLKFSQTVGGDAGA